MKLSMIILLSFILLSFESCAQEIPNPEEQIGAAVMAAPEEQREKAMVYGYDAKGNVVVLREGTNNMVCIGDNPNQEGFNVACYHKDLEPFMARGRALKAEGKNFNEIFDIREEEAKSGELQMPPHGSTLHVLSGPEGKYDPATNEVTGANLRYVVYIPFETAESTGLPTKPLVPGGAWIMNPGTHRAHIMITPPAQD